MTLTAVTAPGLVFAPRVSYQPLGADGTVVTGVTVRTAFGSDDGGVLVPDIPGLASAIDLLAFSGPNAGRVRSVAVTFDSGPGSDATPWTGGHEFDSAKLTAKGLDASGKTPQLWTQVRSEVLYNANPFPVRESVFWLDFVKTTPQFFHSVALVSTVTVPANSHVAVKLPATVVSGIALAVKAGRYQRLQTVLPPEQPGLTWP